MHIILLMYFIYVGFRPLVVIIPPSLLYIPRRHFHFESSCTWTFKWVKRRLPPWRGLLSEIISFQDIEYFFWGFFILYWYLVLNIWYQSSRSWGFAATSEIPWNFFYNFVSTKFQKEQIGGYLVDGSRYIGFKI